MKLDRPNDPKVFHLEVGKRGRGWLIPVDVPNRADYIYCTDSNNWDNAGEGFGGNTLKFKLDTGDEFFLRGGWHSNSNSLFQDTGIDIKNEHYTHIVTVVTSKDGVTKEVVYDEEGWVLDDFDRVEDIRWFEEFILPVLASIQITKYSLGGSQTWTLVNKNEI